MKRKLHFVLIALTGLVCTAEAQPFQILPLTAFWKYETSCLDGAGWEQQGYNDTTWLFGPGGFTGGESSASILTVCSTQTLPPPNGAQNGRAMYFRTRFNVPSTNDLSLTFSNAIDDAAVFYLNGVRIFDLRVPANPATCNTLGGGAIGPDTDALLWEETTLDPTGLAGILVPGDNVLAVSVHQVNTTSSDMVFACAITGQVRTKTWTGAVNGDWSTPGNWVNNLAPVDGDNLVFPASAARTETMNNYPALTAFNSISTRNKSYVLNGNPLRLHNGVHVDNSSADVLPTIINLPLVLTQPQSFSNRNRGAFICNASLDNGGHDLTVQLDIATNLFQGAMGISGAGGLVIDGRFAEHSAVTLAGSGDNTFTGTTRVNAGALHLAKSGTARALSGPLVVGNGVASFGRRVRLIGPGMNQIADAVPITLNIGSMNFENAEEAVGPLTMVPGGAIYTDSSVLILTGDVSVGQPGSGYSTIAGRIRLAGPGLVRNFTVNGEAVEQNLIISGEITSSTGVGLRKDGPGVLVLDLHSGGSYPKLEIAQGAVEVYWSHAGTDVDLAGGILAGDYATVSRITSSSGGGVSPGYVPGYVPGGEIIPGVLFCGNVVWNPNTTYFVELGSPFDGDYDRLVVTGTVNLGGSRLNLSLAQLYKPVAGHTLTILSNDLTDAVTGTFAGLAEGDTVSAGGSHFRISYAGGDGNDITLTVLGSPPLDIGRPAMDSLAISWPFPSAGFVLQQNTNGIATVNWSNVIVAVQDDLEELTRTAVVSPAVDTCFYRLFKP